LFLHTELFFSLSLFYSLAIQNQLSMADNKDFNWFSFYPNKFFFGVQELDDHIVGRYIKLLCLQWFKGSISPDFPGMSDILTVTGEIISVEPLENDPRGGSRPLEGGLNPLGPSTIKIRLDTRTLWEALQPKFTMVGIKRYANDFLEREREITNERIEKHKLSVESGREGGKISAALRAQKVKTPSNHPSTPPSTSLDSFLKGEVQPLVLVPSQPITLHYSDNTLTQKNLKKEDGEKIPQTLEADKLAQRMEEVVRNHWDFMREAGDLKDRPENFQKFVVEYWKKNVLAIGLNGNAKTLRKNFVDLCTSRMDVIEKAFIRQERDLNWFNDELLKVIDPKELSNPVVKKFCEYYARELETGGYFFQSFPNFSVATTLREWFATEKPKRGGGVSLTKKSTQTLFDPPKSASNPTIVLTHTNEAKKGREPETENYLNERFSEYLKTGEVKRVNSFYYQYLLEFFPKEVPPHEMVEVAVFPTVYQHRAEYVRTLHKGKTEEGTRRLEQLKEQYEKGEVDEEEKVTLSRLAYCEATKGFFQRRKNFGDKKIF
jgi:hypothetical protein